MKLYELKKLFNNNTPGKLRFYNSSGNLHMPLNELSDSLFFEFHFYRDKYSLLFDSLEEEIRIAYNRER